MLAPCPPPAPFPSRPPAHHGADLGAYVRKNRRIFYEKRMAQEVAADQLGDEFKGYVVRITGGNDVRACPQVCIAQVN